MEEALKLKIIKGSPFLLECSNLFLYHRTLNEIIDFGYDNFSSCVGLFRLSDEELFKITNIPDMPLYDYLMVNGMVRDSEIWNIFKRGCRFFLGVDDVIIDTEKQLISCSLGEISSIEITKEGFEEIQNYINLIYNGEDTKEDDDYEGLSEAERQMKEKFKRLKALREKTKNKEDRDDSKTEFSDLIGGFVSRSMNMTLEQTLKLPYYTFFFLLRKLKNYDDYDLQLQAMLAGAKDVQIHHWLQGSGEEDE